MNSGNVERNGIHITKRTICIFSRHSHAQISIGWPCWFTVQNVISNLLTPLIHSGDTSSTPSRTVLVMCLFLLSCRCYRAITLHWKRQPGYHFSRLPAPGEVRTPSYAVFVKLDSTALHVTFNGVTRRNSLAHDNRCSSTKTL